MEVEAAVVVEVEMGTEMEAREAPRRCLIPSTPDGCQWCANPARLND